jgi:hypothetical protein
MFNGFLLSFKLSYTFKKSIQDQHIFIEVQQLKPKDVFGLINIVFDSVGQSTNVSLVSEGSECILIDKTFFINNMSENFREILGKTVISCEVDLVDRINMKLSVFVCFF